MATETYHAGDRELTPALVRKLATLAVQAALDAPLRPPPGWDGHPAGYGRKAGVAWETILEIRAAADAAGIDWRKYHRGTKR